MEPEPENLGTLKVYINSDAVLNHIGEARRIIFARKPGDLQVVEHPEVEYGPDKYEIHSDYFIVQNGGVTVVHTPEVQNNNPLVIKRTVQDLFNTGFIGFGPIAMLYDGSQSGIDAKFNEIVKKLKSK